MRLVLMGKGVDIQCKTKQMTPKDKAKELFDRYKTFVCSNDFYGDYDTSILLSNAKRCALIAVDEIIDAIDWHEFETPNKEINYWLDVRKEINNLL
jgi:hypothetical protein